MYCVFLSFINYLAATLSHCDAFLLCYIKKKILSLKACLLYEIVFLVLLLLLGIYLFTTNRSVWLHFLVAFSVMWLTFVPSGINVFGVRNGSKLIFLHSEF